MEIERPDKVPVGLIAVATGTAAPFTRDAIVQTSIRSSFRPQPAIGGIGITWTLLHNGKLYQRVVDKYFLYDY